MEMDMNTFKKNHPDLYAAAVALGRAQGVAERKARERARITGILAASEKFGAKDDFVLDLIRKGTSTEDAILLFSGVQAGNQNANNPHKKRG